MTPEQDKTLERLAKAVEVMYDSPGRMFWRSFVLGFGRGLGTLLGWLMLIAIIYYLLKISGIGAAFHELIQILEKISNSINGMPFPK